MISISNFFFNQETESVCMSQRERETERYVGLCVFMCECVREIAKECVCVCACPIVTVNVLTCGLSCN